jgi:hypothetical protein
MLARRRTEWLGRVTGERVDARLVAGVLLRKMREHVHRVAYIQKSPARVCGLTRGKTGESVGANPRAKSYNSASAISFREDRLAHVSRRASSIS